MPYFPAPASVPYRTCSSTYRSSGPASYEALRKMLKLSESEVPLAARNRLRFRYLARGSVLCAVGGALESVFAVFSGSFKGVIRVHDKEAVSRIIMSPDLVGLDAICSGRYCCDVVALTDSIVIEIPYLVFKSMCGECTEIRIAVIKHMSKAVHDGMMHMRMLASNNAHMRLAGFFVWLSRRTSENGLPPGVVTLHMSRSELGSYLGLAHETVSRAIGKLREMQYVTISGSNVEIKDFYALEVIAGSKGSACRVARKI